MTQTGAQTIVRRVEEIAARVAVSAGVELVEVEWRGAGRDRVLRIYIDKEQGVTHADCERVSHELGTILDVEDFIPGGGYRLEVSSPGLERKLVRPRDYERSLGRQIRVSLDSPVENRRTWQGILIGFDGEVIQLEVAGNRSIAFPLKQVQRANLVFEW